MDHSLVFQDYDYFRLDVAIIIFLGNKCVCDMGETRGEYGSRMYSYHCNEKWLMDSHNSCWCLVLLRVWKERREWLILKYIEFVTLMYSFFIFLIIF